MRELEKLGVGFYIDDFGTGSSTLSRLKQSPFSGLKIDISFVRGLPDEKDSKAIVQSLLTLAENIGVDVIAEGVETQEQADYLQQAGCPKAQGFLYSKPITLEALIKLFKQ